MDEAISEPPIALRDADEIDSDEKDRYERDVITDVGRAAAVRMVEVCRPPGQAAVVYIGATIHELEEPGATW